MGQWFTLPTEKNGINIFSCSPYYPYRVNGERNSKFDSHSGFILTSKSSQERNFGQAVRYFSNILLSEVPGWPLEQWQPVGTDLRMIHGRPLADVMLVPSSKVGKVSDGLAQIVERLCARDRRLFSHATGLVRTREISKLAAGGSRQLRVHMESISFRPRQHLSGLVVLVDDVCTSGNSLIACCDIIQRANPSTSVVGIVLGKTTHD